jgi:hypothetical protein
MGHEEKEIHMNSKKGRIDKSRKCAARKENEESKWKENI